MWNSCPSIFYFIIKYNLITMVFSEQSLIGLIEYFTLLMAVPFLPFHVFSSQTQQTLLE